MKYLLYPLRLLYVLYAFVLFLFLMILIFPFVIIASFFGSITGGNWVYALCRFWSDTWLFFIGIKHEKVEEQPVDPNRNYIFVFNHISYLDVPQLVKAIRQHMRALGKIEMVNYPVFGFIYKVAVVTVNRSDAEHRAESIKKLKSVLAKGISIALAPEGTFNMKPVPLARFYDGAFRISIETQTPIKPLLFLDTYDLMHYRNLFTLQPGTLRTVYLEEVSPVGYSLETLEDYKQHVYQLMERKLLEYKASWINLQDHT